MSRRVELILLGPHTRIVASLCAACPMGPAGCCAAPPGLSWADIARIAHLGGASWLVEEMRSGRLRRGPRGLIIDRISMGEGAPEGGGDGKKCVYHGEMGCTVPADRRSAACNYYICGDALATEEPINLSAEAACSAWTTQYAAWDEVLSAEVGSWAGRSEDEAETLRLFEHLGRRFEEISSEPAHPYA